MEYKKQQKNKKTKNNNIEKRWHDRVHEWQIGNSKSEMTYYTNPVISE